jgi:hypothetical protein
VAEVLDEGITTAILRTAIRERISAGISRRTVSFLINAYAPPTAQGRDDGSGVQRLPVEVIPHERRAAFLCELARLRDDLPVAPVETGAIEPLRGTD